MTAEEARNITIESKAIMDTINATAFSGKSKIVVSSLSITTCDGLKKLGYIVRTLKGGINETNYEISW